MIVSFVYPSGPRRAGGVSVLYELANVLARRGHEVHFIHGPAINERVDRLDDVPFRFDCRVRHHLADSLDDPALPVSDVVFGVAPERLGLPVNLIQGFRLLAPHWDEMAFRRREPKVCVARWLVEVGRSYGVPEEQLVHVPLGLDHTVFTLPPPSRERSIDVAVLHHRFAAKGWDVALAVLHELVRARPGMTATVLSLAGAPPESVPTGVELALDLDHPRVADEVLGRARVFLQASHYEGFGLTAIEAMACGAALVTTDCGGSRDYAVPDETARVRPAGDVAGLVAACAELLDDEVRRRMLAEAGHRFVQRFDWERSGEILERFLERYVTEPDRYRAPPGEDRSEEFAL